MSRVGSRGGRYLFPPHTHTRLGRNFDHHRHGKVPHCSQTRCCGCCSGCFFLLCSFLGSRVGYVSFTSVRPSQMNGSEDRRWTIVVICGRWQASMVTKTCWRNSFGTWGRRGECVCVCGSGRNVRNARDGRGKKKRKSGYISINNRILEF